MKPFGGIRGMGAAGILAAALLASPGHADWRSLDLENRVAAAKNTLAFSTPVPIGEIRVTPAKASTYAVFLDEALRAYAKKAGADSLWCVDYALSPDAGTAAFQVEGFHHGPYSRILTGRLEQHPTLSEWKLPAAARFESASDPAIGMNAGGQPELYFVANKGLWDTSSQSGTGVIVKAVQDKTYVLGTDGWQEATGFRKAGEDSIDAKAPQGTIRIAHVNASNPIPYTNSSRGFVTDGIYANRLVEGRLQIVMKANDAPEQVTNVNDTLNFVLATNLQLASAYHLGRIPEPYVTSTVDCRTGEPGPGIILVGKDALDQHGLQSLAVPLRGGLPCGIRFESNGTRASFESSTIY